MQGDRKDELTDEELLALGERLDETDFGDVWDQTYPVDFEFAPNLRSNCVVISPELMEKVRAKAEELGKPTDALIEEWLESHVAAGAEERV